MAPIKNTEDADNSTTAESFNPGFEDLTMEQNGAENDDILELDDTDGFFFEVEEAEQDDSAEFLSPIAEPPTTSEQSLASSAPLRKIRSFEIPPGHADLDDEDRLRPIPDFSEEDPQSFVGGLVKGRYRVVDFLGGDENGLAYLAVDSIVTDRQVLVRILTGEPADELLASILAEERVSLSHFTHPNIARMIDSGEFTNGFEYIISEYVDALSVRDILGLHGRFTVARAARVIRQVSNALNEAHQEGILHRDIRPENLIVDPTAGEVEIAKLVNFGASAGEPNEHNFMYKAPEVLRGRTPTASSDVYSLAVVAYEMLTGEPPFEGSSEREIVRSQFDGIAHLVSSVTPLSPTIDTVFEKALAFKPNERYTKVRDFADAFTAALSEAPRRTIRSERVQLKPIGAEKEHEEEILNEEEQAMAEAFHAEEAGIDAEPAWKNRSPEPPPETSARAKWLIPAIFLLLAALIGGGWFYISRHQQQTDVPQTPEKIVPEGKAPEAVKSADMPPLPRDIPQPPNTTYYENSKQNLKGDLLLNFVGFKLYYPTTWKVNGPQSGVDPNTRGKFLDISRLTPDGRMKEQMLISYYPSKGTFAADQDKFPELVKESNETLTKLLPGYQVISEGETRINGDWKAYEMKFQGSGTSPTGATLYVWGRRLFVPASRLGVRDGFEITMLATSLADEVKGVDDVGIKGELGPIIYSFEPSQNF